MKRAVSVAAVSFLLILAVSFFCDFASHRASDAVLENAWVIDGLAREGKKAQAMEAAGQLKRDWEKQAEFLSYFSHHSLMDAITEAILQTEAALETENAFGFASGVEGLKKAAKALYEQEAFLLKNLW